MQHNVKFESEKAKELYGGELKYATPGSAAFDLRAVIDLPLEVKPQQVVKVSAGVHVWLNDANYVIIGAPRSGLGTKGLVLGNTIAVIDSDYQNNISIVLYNRSHTESFMVNPGDRVCQAMIVPVLRPDFNYVDDFHAETERGVSGFGSSGVQ